MRNSAIQPISKKGKPLKIPNSPANQSVSFSIFFLLATRSDDYNSIGLNATEQRRI